MTSSETTFNDAELIARLRDAKRDWPEFGHDRAEAADRIEELIEESGRRLALARSEGVARVEQFEQNEALTEQLAAARQDAKEAEAYAEELETKLAMAVEALEKIAGAADKEWVTVSGDAPADVQNLCDIARTTLAEIKGESHE